MAYILIVDDDEIIAEFATQILINAGHACGFVCSGEEAWDLMQHRRPDLILMDHNMPGITGVSLLRKLRSSARLYDTPVMMFTAMRGEADENRALYAGAQDYIRKPFQPDSLVRLVERVLADHGTGSHLDLSERLARDSGLDEGARRLARRYV